MVKGEDVNIGFARETARGTYEAPTIWVPGRTPAGMKVVVDKTPIKETTGSGVSTSGSVVVQERASGPFEFNVRNGSICFPLLSNLGKVTTSTLETGVYQHVFEILAGNPQHPTLSLGLSQPNGQDYRYIRTLATLLGFKFVKDDLVSANAQFEAAQEAVEGTGYTVAFPDDDYYFRHQDVSVKLADDISGLGAAGALSLKTLDFNSNNNGRPNQHIGELNPGDMYALMHEIGGKFELDYADETYHDLYKDGTYKAMRIAMTRSDITIGAANNPSITIDLARVSFETRDQDRPIDDILRDQLEYMAHYSSDEGYAIKVTVVNEIASLA